MLVSFKNRRILQWPRVRVWNCVRRCNLCSLNHEHQYVYHDCGCCGLNNGMLFLISPAELLGDCVRTMCTVSNIMEKLFWRSSRTCVLGDMISWQQMGIPPSLEG